MRARYAAYALGEVDFLLASTDPSGPQFEADQAAWRASVARFSRETEFLGLEVLEASSEGNEGRVAFRVRLTQGGRDASFGERSRFRRVKGSWLYHSGAPL